MHAYDAAPLTERPHVAHLGPDPAGPVRMPAVTRGLLASPLARLVAGRLNQHDIGGRG